MLTESMLAKKHFRGVCEVCGENIDSSEHAYGVTSYNNVPGDNRYVCLKCFTDVVPLPRWFIEAVETECIKRCGYEFGGCLDEEE